MDAKEFFREQTRMLNAHGRISDSCTGLLCTNCPLGTDGYNKCNTEEAVDIVEAWSKEHPKKTYLDVLLEAFPNTTLNLEGTPYFCPYNLGLIKPENCGKISCIDCWNTEYKEDN